MSNKFPCGVTNLATSRNGNDSNEDWRDFSGAEYKVAGGVGDGFLEGTPYKVDGGVGLGFLGKLCKVGGRLSDLDVTSFFLHLEEASGSSLLLESLTHSNPDAHDPQK